MKKIVLISNYVFHYRIGVYNYLNEQFQKIGYTFQVLTWGAQKVDFDLNFRLDVQKRSMKIYTQYIEKEKPDAIILFLHLKDKIIFPLLVYCRFKSLPIIYWNFGINIVKPNAFLKNVLYYQIHNLADGLILYSPNELKFIKQRNKKKAFIGYNSLNYSNFDRSLLTEKNYLKKKFNIKESKIVLFIGRMIPSKKLDVLLECFRNNKNIAVVVAGKGIKQEMLEIINSVDNYYHIGEISYDNFEIAKVFYSIDILCIPGNLGLAIIESFFWGKPVATLNELNSPEIYYLKDEVNGILAERKEDLENKIATLLSDEHKYERMSVEAANTYTNEMHISNMFNGFKNAVEYVTDKHKK